MDGFESGEIKVEIDWIIFKREMVGGKWRLMVKLTLFPIHRFYVRAVILPLSPLTSQYNTL